MKDIKIIAESMNERDHLQELDQGLSPHRELNYRSDWNLLQSLLDKIESQAIVETSNNWSIGSWAISIKYTGFSSTHPVSKEPKLKLPIKQ